MPDLGLLALPILGATGVLLLALFVADDIAIDNIRVPPTLEWNGYTDVVVTRMLSDQLREINQTALELQLGIEVDDSRYDASASEFEEYFGLTQLVTGVRELIGVIPYYVSAEITDDSGRLTFTGRIFIDQANASVHVIRAEGDPAAIDTLLNEAALRILEHINPYIVALHYHDEELDAQDYRFDRTREMLEKSILRPPPKDNYLAYDLLGRMHLERAKCDSLLSSEERAAERAKAHRWLHVALENAPDHLSTNSHLAVLHLQSGEFGLADRYFATAVRSDPNYWPVRERWGRALAEQGRIREAIFQYVAAVELNRSSVALRRALSDLYRKAGRPEAAQAQFRRAVSMDPDVIYAELRVSSGHVAAEECEL